MSEVSLLPGNAGQIGGHHPVLVVGFSARSLAEAVNATGLPVFAVDHFGDADLREVSCWVETIRVWHSGQDAKRALERILAVPSAGAEQLASACVGGGGVHWTHPIHLTL